MSGCKRYGRIKTMNKPNTENVHYIDEYPHIEQKLAMKRSNRPIGELGLVIAMPGLREQYDKLMQELPDVGE